MIKSMIIILLAAAFPPFLAGAAELARDSVTLRFYYPKNVTDSVLVRQENAEAFNLLDTLSGDWSFDSVKIDGWASPESPEDYNLKLSADRAEFIRRMLSDRYDIPDSVFTVTGRGEDWLPVLEYLDETRSMDIAPRRNTLREIASGTGNADARERALRLVGGGIPYRVLLEEAYPRCRYAEASISFSRRPPGADSSFLAVPCVADTTGLTAPPALLQASEDTIIRDWRVALRTNLLVPALNAGVQVQVGPHLSLGADWYYPWIWPPRDNRWCFELLGLGLEGRWWFSPGDDPLLRATGPSAGLGVMAGYYDFEKDYSGRQGEYACIVADGQYGFPLRGGLWRLTVGLGVGFLYTRYREYDVPGPGGRLFRTGNWSQRQRYFGPLRAEVSLAVPLWRPHTVKKEDLR